MSAKWYGQVSNDLGKIPECIEYYENQLEEDFKCHHEFIFNYISKV